MSSLRAYIALLFVSSVRAFLTSTVSLSTTRQTAFFPPLHNAYDDWRSDAVAPVVPLDEDNVKECLDVFIESDYGKTMFGRHDLPASYGITGDLEFVELQGPEVILSLSGMFWHRRETVLGRAAVWLNACMPEIVEVRVEDPEELKDFEEIMDEDTGEVLEVRDKRAPDFNGDRATMEYQGMDADMRGKQNFVL